MKITQVYFQYAQFRWDCFQCGRLNSFQISDGQLNDQFVVNNQKIGKKWDDKKVNLVCGNCGAKRRGILVVAKLYPYDDEELKSKLKRIEKHWYKKWAAKALKAKKKHIEELKAESKSKKKRRK